MKVDLQPVWLLDIDGVLNTHPTRAAQRNVVRTPTDDWTIDWNPAIIEVIKDVYARDVVDLVWLTTWEPEIHLISPLFDMPFLPCGHQVLHTVSTKFPNAPVTDWSKRLVFNHYRSLGHPVVWTDDSAIDVREVNDTVGSLDDVLFIRPNYRIGLTPEHLVLIMSFIGRYANKVDEQ